MNPNGTILKADGRREAFDVSKLHGSLMRSGATPEMVEQAISKVMSEFKDGMSTHDIYKHAFEILYGLEQSTARKYSLRRQVMNLGPTGFIFEDLVAEILKEKGFETLTDQTVLGVCVPHEVDVVAWNNDKLIMVEAKFHNELGIKSDLKVALYVKARIDDLKQNTFRYGGRERKLDEGWLITNTKFSSTALRYGECAKVTMIGWNYPAKGNLQDMIEASPHVMSIIFDGQNPSPQKN